MSFHIEAAPATNERAHQSPNGEVKEGEDHAADPPNTFDPAGRHRYCRPFTQQPAAHPLTLEAASARQ
jgi:hypothetical protein